MNSRLRNLGRSGRKAIAWVAYNDDDACLDASEIENQISVVLICDVWNLKANEVAALIVAMRRHDANAVAGMYEKAKVSE